VSVNEIDAQLYLPGHPREASQRALRIPALSPGWQESLRSLLDQADRDSVSSNSGLNPTAGAPPPAWSGFPAVEGDGREDGVRLCYLSDPCRSGRFTAAELACRTNDYAAHPTRWRSTTDHASSKSAECGLASISLECAH
jgi:hypothetical protein